MADYYDSLSAADQQTFRNTLFAVMNPGACPSVDVGTISSPSALVDAGTRAAAIDCMQTALSMPAAGGPGVLDQATYLAIMNRQGMPLWEKAGLVLVAALAAIVLFGKKKRRK